MAGTEGTMGSRVAPRSPQRVIHQRPALARVESLLRNISRVPTLLLAPMSICLVYTGVQWEVEWKLFPCPVILSAAEFCFCSIHFMCLFFTEPCCAYPNVVCGYFLSQLHFLLFILASCEDDQAWGKKTKARLFLMKWNKHKSLTSIPSALPFPFF